MLLCMSEVIMVEGGHPLGMRTGDPYYPLANALPYERPGHLPDPDVIRRRITHTSADVTPEILEGREKWILSQGPNAAFLTRIEPPTNLDSLDDIEYAHQHISELTAGVIHTPEDMVAERICPLRREISPLIPDQTPDTFPLPGFDAAWFWFRRTPERDAEDFAGPSSTDDLALLLEEFSPSL